MGTDSLAAGRIGARPEEQAATADVRRGVVPMRLYREGDETQLLSLHRRVMNTPWDEALWRWLYFENPDGRAIIVVAEDGGQIVGHFAAFPLRMWFAGRTVLGSKSVQAMVDPAYQGRGLFTRVTANLLERAAAGGVAFTYSCPNRKSYHPLVNKLGYRNISGRRTGQYAGDRGLPMWVRPLPGGRSPAAGGWKASVVRGGLWAGAAVARWCLSRPAAGRGGPVRVMPVEGFDGRFDELWQACRERFVLAKVRDRSYLNWRYVSRPGRRYTLLAAEFEGRLTGFMVVGCYDLDGWRIGAVVDFLVHPDVPEAFEALLLAALGACQEERAVACCAAATRVEEWRRLRRLGFLRVPDRFAPRKFFFIVHPNLPEVPEEVLCHEANWFLTFGDWDVY